MDLTCIVGDIEGSAVVGEEEGAFVGSAVTGAAVGVPVVGRAENDGEFVGCKAKSKYLVGSQMD